MLEYGIQLKFDCHTEYVIIVDDLSATETYPNWSQSGKNVLKHAFLKGLLHCDGPPLDAERSGAKVQQVQM